MSELLPCPFCGGEAELVEGEYGMYLSGYAIYCKGTCGAKLGVTGRLCEAYEWTPYFDTEAEATAAWNSRAERTCKQEERGWGTEGDHARVWLTCGHDCMVPTVQDLPNYCPNCGCKVVGE